MPIKCVVYCTVYEDNYLPISSVSIATACSTRLLDVWLHIAYVSTARSNRLCRQIRSVYINSSRLHSY